MSITKIIALSGEIQDVDENMDPVTAILFVLKFKYTKELNEKTVPLFESITKEMQIEVNEHKNWTHHSQLRESFYHYVRTHIPRKKMNMMLAILLPVED